MTKIRLRFAPSPTGMMHLGNIRTAVINYLFAHQKNGVFILRIEDTDTKRMLDPDAEKILADLGWLNVFYDEGPIIHGPCSPYYQSKRLNLYEEKRKIFQNKNLIYRCFCTEEILKKKRNEQIALKLPPRYDRICLSLPNQEVINNILCQVPFVWRFKLDHNRSVTINDLAHGATTFQLNHFSDFAITRQDGSFTFLFANFVDDWTMNITHIFRGEDHLSNSANQAAMFDALQLPLPTYWHMPILCNLAGKKLSKRDFGFSLRDLKDAGFTAQAITNYVSIIGNSFKKEIMPLDEIVKAYNFESISSSGRITYDLEKLKWVNKQWIQRYSPEELHKLCMPFLKPAYSIIERVNPETIKSILQIIKPEMVTLADSVPLLSFYFNEIELTEDDISSCISPLLHNITRQIMIVHKHLLSQPDKFVSQIKAEAKENDIQIKQLFCFLRLALTGKINGPGIRELIEMLGKEKSKTRIDAAVKLLI